MKTSKEQWNKAGDLFIFTKKPTYIRVRPVRDKGTMYLPLDFYPKTTIKQYFHMFSGDSEQLKITLPPTAFPQSNLCYIDFCLK